LTDLLLQAHIGGGASHNLTFLVYFVASRVSNVLRRN
jgi:hypothetical protein